MRAALRVSNAVVGTSGSATTCTSEGRKTLAITSEMMTQANVLVAKDYLGLGLHLERCIDDLS